MKSLDQVEARIPVNGSTTPGDDNYHFIISQPGSYYLSGNVNVTRANGIDVRAAGVTLDLNGFQIARSPAGGGAGIDVQAAADRCTVKNGTIAGFATGLRATIGAEGGSAIDLSVSGCSAVGIVAGDGWEVTGCEAHKNGGIGIEGLIGCTITRCTAYDNGGVGIKATRAKIHQCTAVENGGDGIQGGTGSVVTGNTAAENAGDGIEVSDGSFVHANTCDNNGLGGSGAGVHALAFGNRIDGNQVTRNDRGIHAAGAGNLIIKNSASGNSTSYAIAADNRYGQIVDLSAPGAPAVNGPSADATTNTFDPWANFTY
jgi:parallel beta-helix repeat protein